MEYREYLKTEHWQKIRKERLAIDENKCCICGKTDGQLDVHHISYSDFEHNNILYNEKMSDLATLCHECHSMLHRIKNKTKQAANKRLDYFFFRDLYGALQVEMYLRDKKHGGDLELKNDELIQNTVNFIGIMCFDKMKKYVQETWAMNDDKWANLDLWEKASYAKAALQGLANQAGYNHRFCNELFLCYERFRAGEKIAYYRKCGGDLQKTAEYFHIQPVNLKNNTLLRYGHFGLYKKAVNE